VAYRQTGVILEITPVIYGDDRVDIQIYQEVSDDEDNSNPTIASPIFNTRSITTTLSLEDGATAVLGGLMEDSFSKGNRGVPFLKDLPLLGQAFRTDTVSGRKTALVVLITPFIVRNTEDMTQLADQVTDEINQAFRAGRGGSYTLTPITTGVSAGLNVPSPRVGQGLTRPQPKSADPAPPGAAQPATIPPAP
jgi:general secretion pathway protein D